MRSPRIEPVRVKPLKIAHVEAVKHTSVGSRKGQLLLVGSPGKTNLQSCHHYDAARTKSPGKALVNRILVDVDLDLAQSIHTSDQAVRMKLLLKEAERNLVTVAQAVAFTTSGASILFFERIRRLPLCLYIFVNLRLVGMVIGKRSMNLSQ